MNRTRVAAGLVAVAAGVSAAVLIPRAVDASPPHDLQAAKAASAKYHSIEQALADGYSGENQPCVAEADGGMGVHYVNQALLRDGVLDPERPEILLYVPGENGKLRLAAVEYVQVDADQNLATDSDRPALFDRPFDGPMEGHGPGAPVHYDLHVWLWEDNPSGQFAPFNPAVICS